MKTGKDIGLGGLWADAEVVSIYTREQALGDGDLVDVTEWASSTKGFHGGFTCPVAMTRALWSKVELPKNYKGCQDTRGRAHDVLLMASLAARGAVARTTFKVKVGNRNLLLLMVIDGDGVTIGYPTDF